MVSPTSSHSSSPMSAGSRLHAAFVPPVMVVTADTAEMSDILAKARAFAEPLMAGETLDSGEITLAHADARQAPLIDPAFLQHPDDVQRKLGGCVARCSGVNYLGVNYVSVIHMHHGQASDMTGASWATGEVKMMQTHRQRLVDVQPYVAE